MEVIVLNGKWRVHWQLYHPDVFWVLLHRWHLQLGHTGTPPIDAPNSIQRANKRWNNELAIYCFADPQLAITEQGADAIVEQKASRRLTHPSLCKVPWKYRTINCRARCQQGVYWATKVPPGHGNSFGQSLSNMWWLLRFPFPSCDGLIHKFPSTLSGGLVHRLPVTSHIWFQIRTRLVKLDFPSLTHGVILVGREDPTHRIGGLWSTSKLVYDLGDKCFTLIW